MNTPDRPWDHEGDPQGFREAENTDRDYDNTDEYDPGEYDDPYRVAAVPDSAEAVVAQLAAVVTSMVDQITAFEERIGMIEAGPQQGKDRFRRLRPHEHPTEAAARIPHGELVQWVSWLVGTYRLSDVVPACWERHDALCEELACFLVAWRAVWSDQTREDSGIVWHEQLYRARERLGKWSEGASCGEHCAWDVTLADRTDQRWRERLERHQRQHPDWHVLRSRTTHAAPGVPPPTAHSKTAKTPKTPKTPKTAH